MRLTVESPTVRAVAPAVGMRSAGAEPGRQMSAVDPDTGYSLSEIRRQCIATNEADRLDGSQEFLDALTADMWAEE